MPDFPDLDEQREIDKALSEYRRWAEENPVEAKLSFLEFDDATMRLPLDDATYTYVVERFVESFWNRP